MTERETKVGNSRRVAWTCGAAAALSMLIGSTPAHAGGAGVQLAGNVTASPAVVERALHRHALKMLDGSKHTLGESAGQVVVINFWATWCRPCVRELPALQQLDQDIAAKGGRVLAVAIDSDARNVMRFVKTHELLGLPVACDGPAGLARELDLQAVPLTLVLDRTGAVAWCSPRSDEAGLAETRAAVQRLLAQPAPPAATPAVAGGDAR